MHHSLESACRPMKMDLKVGFQAAVCNTTDAMHAHEKRNSCKDRIDCVHCFSRACVAYFFFLIASQAVCPLHVLRTTAWKAHVGL